MDLFVSKYINKIDKKGRVSLPSSFRNVLPKANRNEIILYKSIKTPSIEGCGVGRLKEIAKRINNLDFFSEDYDDFSTSIFSEIVTTNVDEEGFKWAEAYMTGGKPNMKRDAYIWMLNGDMGEDNMNSSFYGGDHDKAKMMGHFIESGPHLMLMPKDTKTIENFPTDFTTGAPYQMFKGTPYAHLMIPVEGYYEFQPDSNPLN